MENNALASDNTSFFPLPLMHRESTWGGFFTLLFLNHNHNQTNNHSKHETKSLTPITVSVAHTKPTDNSGSLSEFFSSPTVIHS